MSQEWLEAGLESRRPEIRHAETSEGPVILEASTEDLRGFVVQFAADPAAFPAVEPGGHGFSLRKLGPS